MNQSKNLDLTKVRPYGDTMNDGMVQVSFTLPVPHSDEAVEAARVFSRKLGLEEPNVAYAKEITQGFTFFVVYGRAVHTVDYQGITVPKAILKTLDKHMVEEFIQERLQRRVRVVGASIETDAHTVGIDAIMNMKGYNGHKGLESYHGFQAYNLGAQVACEDVIAYAVKVKADAILVSQSVTQKNVHVTNLTKLVDMLEAEGVREQFLLVVGGPRITHQFAKELGYDAGFGSGTYAEDVASFLVQELAKLKTVRYTKMS